MVWATGQRLYGDRYIIESQLGGGGFGITYLARDRKGNFVVIKTLKDEVLAKADLAVVRDKFQQDFRNEALRLALCRHRHVVQIENAFHEGHIPCIAMEYIPGENLWQRVSQRGFLSEAQALKYIKQIADALICIHDKGLLHRDVKPQNIMVRAGREEAVLIDFGIAREFIPDITQTHTLAVSNGFAPIEQYAEQAHRGEFTDVYGLAATLYYLLTAKLPTPSFVRAAKVPLTPPQYLNPSISDAVVKAILKGMEFEPQARPQSVPEWLEILNTTPIIDDEAPTMPMVLETQTVIAPSSSPSLTTSITDDLSSDVGLDYSNLRDLLASAQWQEADRETATLMLKVYSQEQQGNFRLLTLTDIAAFPCQDLYTIDNLWVKYSRGRFGFSIQKHIWESIGGNSQADNETWYRFSDRVEWRVNGNWLEHNDLTFTHTATDGHLPGLLLWRWFVCDGRNSFPAFMSRLETCNIQSLAVDDLSSTAGIDYSHLRDLLAAGRWQQADVETSALMVRVCHREEDDWLDCEHIETFPSIDLKTINNLWLKYSNGHFGFSLQKRIYNDYGQDYSTFGDCVQWRVNGRWLWWDDLTFNLQTPPGHLPSWRFGGSGGVWGCLITCGAALLCREEL